MDAAIGADLFYGLLNVAYLTSGDRVDHIAYNSALLDVYTLLLKILELFPQSFTFNGKDVFLKTLLRQKLCAVHRLLYIFDHIVADV